MRAKDAAQIRRGVRAAYWAIGYTETVGRPPIASPFKLTTDLEMQAYDRTIKHVVGMRIVGLGRRMLDLMERTWPGVREDS